MVLEEIDLRLAGTGEAEIIKIIGKVDGIPIGGTNITPVNLNLGSGKTADGIFLGGNEITGLSGGSQLHRIYIGSSNTTTTFNFGQDIIVPKNNTISIWAVNLDIEIAFTLLFNYHNVDAG